MTRPADPRAALEALQAGVSRLAHDLYRLETDADLQPLRDPGGVTGRSAAVVAAAGADLPGAWICYDLLTDAVERLAKAVEADDRDRAAAALGPAAVELVDGRRCSPHELLAALRDDVDVLITTGERLAAAWREVIPKLDAAVRRLDDLSAAATAIGVARDPSLVSATRVVDDVSAAAGTDPLSVNLSGMEAAVERAGRRIAELQALHAKVPDRLRAGRDLLDELFVLIPDGQAALHEACAKIAAPEGLLEPLSPNDLDAGPLGLRPWLTRLERTFRSGQWLPVSEGLDAWENVARGWLGNARAVVDANRAPLRRRSELRGLLDAYAAKAAAMGRAEDRELAALHAGAHDALYTRPCDLDAAAELVARYGAGLGAAPPRAAG